MKPPDDPLDQQGSGSIINLLGDLVSMSILTLVECGMLRCGLIQRAKQALLFLSSHLWLGLGIEPKLQGFFLVTGKLGNGVLNLNQRAHGGEKLARHPSFGKGQFTPPPSLDAGTGKLIWKQRAVAEDRRIPGNGRVISNWPVRTSVIVRDGLLYTTAGMFPSEGVHVVALDAATGDVKWRQIQSDLPAQGYLLASASRLYVPAGRDNPVVCELSTGKRLRVVEGAGGTYALLTGDMLVFGPGKTGQLEMVEDGQKDQLATFQGNHMIVTTNPSFLHSDTELSGLDRARYMDLAQHRKKLGTEQGRLTKELRTLAKKPGTEAAQQKVKDQLAELGQKIDATTEGMQQCILWRIECRWPLGLILAKGTLVAGGSNEAATFDSEHGTLRWTHPVVGHAYGLVVADSALLVSTDEGVIHCPLGNRFRDAQ